MNSPFGSLKVRFDPWSPDYGASLMAGEESEAWLLKKVEVDVSVEIAESEWRPIYCDPARDSRSAVAFVDGVRRIESNLVFERPDGFLFGAFGCCAAGAVVLTRGHMNDLDQALRICSVQRYLFAPDDTDLQEVVELPQSYPRGSTIPHTVIPLSENDPQEPLRRLQQLMRQEEALVTEQIGPGDAELVIADGPLSLSLIRPGIAGFIKSLHSFYIAPSLFPVLTSLRKHERTPLFRLSGENAVERYSAYVRINEPHSRDTILAGLARFEVAGSGGMEQARQVIDRCAAIVPLFASPYGRDPRAPQNLLPISVLELELRRRLGNQEIMKRIYQEALASQESA